VSEWFTRWFGKEYLDLYPHRNEAEARAAVALIERAVDVSGMKRALDLACGTGRHTRVLCDAVWTVGLDLSAALLEVARAESPHVPYVRGDMRRLPFAPRSFGLVVNLFTSFGYFDTDEENRAVLAEVKRVIEPGGWFVLDYLNAFQVYTRLVPEDTRRIGPRLVTQRRRITPDGRFVEKRISSSDSTQTYLERVRLLEPASLRALLTDAGFGVEQAFGNYAGAPLQRGSQRVILVARAT
jgi:SAM-dependent methyltransferase